MEKEAIESSIYLRVFEPQKKAVSLSALSSEPFFQERFLKSNVSGISKSDILRA
jgi:hypothetical protein